MADKSKIEWCDATFNPWWGCEEESPACAFCYARKFAHRYGHELWGGHETPRRFFGDKHWSQPIKWNEKAKETGEPFRVFCGSMCDICEDREDLFEPRARLMRLIEATPYLTWLLLTKRPQNFIPFFGRRWNPGGWPKNIVAMCTAEDQKRADERIPELLKVPVPIHAVSYEPALEMVNWRTWLVKTVVSFRPDRVGFYPGGASMSGYGDVLPKIDQIIIGGESGPGARPIDIEWVRQTVKDCKATGTSAFVKQMGKIWAKGRPDWGRGRKDRKGAVMSEWPEDLRIREFPKGEVT